MNVPYGDQELGEIISKCEGMRDPNVKISTEMKIDYLELEIAARKILIQAQKDRLSALGLPS